MTDDIVERLRCYADINDAVFHPWVYAEAADKIEWMLKEIQQLKHDSTIFINERSDAICENFDLREENAELREKIERLRGALLKISELEPEGPLGNDCMAVSYASETARAALEGEASDDAAT
jgi:FtsZ-binding cell division protein ZapB